MSATRRPVSRLKRFVRRVALGSIVTVATAAVTAPAWAPQLVTPLAERFFRSKQLDGTVGAIEIAWPRITVRGIAIGNPHQGHTYVDERFLQVDRGKLWLRDELKMIQRCHLCLLFSVNVLFGRRLGLCEPVLAESIPIARSLARPLQPICRFPDR